MKLLCILLTLILTCVRGRNSEHADILMGRGSFEQARMIYLDLVAKNPEDVEALQGVAICSINLGDAREAIAYFEKAIALKSAPELHYNTGRIYHQLGDLPASVKHFQLCSATKSTIERECLIKLAQVYRDTNRLDDVQLYLNAAIKLDPTKPDAYMYLADTYNNMKQFKLAIETYDRVIKLAPNNPSAWNSKGDAYSNLKKPREAFDCYSTARDLSNKRRTSPEFLDAVVGQYYSSLDLSKWIQWERRTLLIERELARYLQQVSRVRSVSELPPPPLSAYRLLFLPVDPAVSVEITALWSNKLVDQTLPLVSRHFNQSVSPRLRGSTAPLHIGYMSRRFEDYPGTQMMIQLFESHNRSRVRVSSFAGGPDDHSVYRSIIKQTSDSFDDIHGQSFDQSVQVLREKELDVLIDYDGMHDFNSIRLLAARPAAVQATWLGFASSTGQGRRAARRPVVALDYLIADATVMSPDLPFSRHTTEHLVLLPGCYQPQDELRHQKLSNFSAGQYLSLLDPIQYSDWSLLASQASSLQAAKESERRRLLLLMARHLSAPAADTLVQKRWLVSFNRQSKITPEAFSDWMQILSRSPSAVLVLMSESAHSTLHLRSEAAFWGVNPSRLLFSDRLDRTDFYSLLSVSDLFLDTRPYTSHTVASDCLRGGVPLLTLEGASFGSRVAHSVLAAADLDVLLVARSRRDMVEVGARIGGGGGGAATQLAMRRLVLNGVARGLFDSNSFSIKAEKAYLAMYESKFMFGDGRVRGHLFFHNSDVVRQFSI